MTVRIVTDSTGDLPSEIVSQYDIAVVPLKVRFGADEYLDGVTLTHDDFYEKLSTSRDMPSTSQPSAGEFAEVYRNVGEGSDGIVSIHISGKLSGTFNSASQAAREPAMPCPVRVIDTESASMGLGLVVLEAAKAARDGADLDTVAAIAADASKRCHCIAMLDTLEYLQRGGRIGKVRALLGTVLSIKPLIVVRDGEVHELGMERTHRRALAKLENTALEHARARYFAVMYSTARDEAEALAKRLECAVPDCEQVFIAQFGPTVGTHVGPNALGVGILDRPPVGVSA